MVVSQIGVTILALTGPTEPSRSVAVVAAGRQGGSLNIDVNVTHALFLGKAIQPARARTARVVQ